MPTPNPSIDPTAIRHNITRYGTHNAARLLAEEIAADVLTQLASDLPTTNQIAAAVNARFAYQTMRELEAISEQIQTDRAQRINDLEWEHDGQEQGEGEADSDLQQIIRTLTC